MPSASGQRAVAERCERSPQPWAKSMMLRRSSVGSFDSCRKNRPEKKSWSGRVEKEHALEKGGCFGPKRRRNGPFQLASPGREGNDRLLGLIPKGSQNRIPKVRTAIRRVSANVRRTRSIVGIPRPTTGVGALFGDDLASCLSREAGVGRGMSMVANARLDVHGAESVAVTQRSPT